MRPGMMRPVMMVLAGVSIALALGLLGRALWLAPDAGGGREGSVTGAALVDERRRGHARQIVGLEVEWTAVEALHEAVGLPPTAPAGTSRVAVPVYKGGTQVGRATSTAWSPSLKKLIALATIDRPHFAEGTRLEMEVTVDAVRHRAAATVVPTPFFDPPRKRRVEPK